jgi:histone H3/H4
MVFLCSPPFLFVSVRLLLLFVDEETENWKLQALPLGRIKKIMKSEEFAMLELDRMKGQELDSKTALTPLLRPCSKFMIAQEAPALMTKACELLIREMTTRAWQHTDTHRRKTLQRADIHAAVGESETFDFLIDIVPRVTTTSADGTNTISNGDN